MKVKNANKGSLTVEAVIAFSIFVSFMFMLLSMVKISLVKITLNNAVAETAKYIATAAYPIGMFNDICEDSNTTVEAYTQEQKLTKQLGETGLNAMFDTMLAGTEAEAIKAQNAGADAVFKAVKNAGVDMLKGAVLTGAKKLIEEQSADAAAAIITEVLDNSHVGIDRDKLTLTIAKFPVPKKTYESGYATERFSELGLSKADFNEDDVVIAVEYVYKLSLPYITTIDIKMRELAIEHAWVNGGGGNIPVRTEGIKLDKIMDAVFGNRKVYVTNYGSKYHKKNCYYLWNSKNEMKKNEAEAFGYTPCTKCSP